MSNLAAIRTRAPQAARQNTGGIVAIAAVAPEHIRALNALGEFKQALAQCPGAAGALQALDDCDGVARVWQEAAWAASYLGHLDKAAEYLGRAQAAGGELYELQLKEDWIRARILREQGEALHALRVFKRLHAAYLKRGAKAQAMHVLIELGHTQLKLRTRNALEPLTRARRYFVRTNSPLQVVLCDYMLAQAQIDLNRFDRADAALRRAQKISREQGARFMDASCDLEIGYLCWATDRFQEMLERSSRACELFKELGVTQEISSAEVNIGVALLELTNYDKAIPYLEKGLSAIKQPLRLWNR